MFYLSTQCRNAILDGLINDFGAAVILHIYAGTVPASANASLGTATKLVTISVDDSGAPLSFEAASDGLKTKSSTENWVGTCEATGTASFYRLVVDGVDTGVEDPTQNRIQGTVGVLNADLLLATTSLILGQEQRVDYYALGMPEAA